MCLPNIEITTQTPIDQSARLNWLSGRVGLLCNTITTIIIMVNHYYRDDYQLAKILHERFFNGLMINHMNHTR